MKLAWISTAVLLISANAFAACPAGTTGSTKWNEAVGTVKRVLSQNLVDGSHAIEIATDGKPLKIDFNNIGGQVQVTVWRSTPPQKFNNKQIQAIADVCYGGGLVKMMVDGNEVDISELAGGKMSVTAAGYGPYTFAGIQGGTEVAAGPNSGK